MHAADKKTRLIAFSAILLAFAGALLFLKTVIPIWDFSIYILISFFPGIILIESNDRWAWLLFAAISLLSLILPVNKLAFLLFYTFFGYYGILKFYIERLKSKYIGFLFKVLLINTALLVNYFLAAAFLPGIFSEGVQLYLLMTVATVFIFIYDYIYTTAMVFYNSKLRKFTGGRGNA